jgi:GT2 family glycosyltransferase
MTRSMVTFVIPVAPHHKPTLQRAVESVRQQTIPCEVIALDDKKGVGPGALRNRALGMVKTPFVVFLDADDFVMPRFAEACLAAWRPNTYVWTHWFEDGLVRPLPHEEGLTVIDHLVTCFMSTDLALSHGGFDEHFSGGEDTDFYVKLLSHGVKSVRVAEPLVSYTQGGQRSTEFHTSGAFHWTMQEISRRYGTNLVDELAQPIADGVHELADALEHDRHAMPKRFVPPPAEPPFEGVKAERRPHCHLSIVVPTYNRLAWLQNMVRSARHALHFANYEFVVVDGGSTDGTLEWCRAEPDVWLVEHGALLGTVKAFSDGAKDAFGAGEKARGVYIILCNDDTEFTPGSIRSAHEWLKTHPTCGCVAFAYDHPHHPGQFVVGQHTFAHESGQQFHTNFANVGMYRADVLRAAGYCGVDDPDFKARSYGSDSYSSIQVWAQGYSVDAVEGALIHDRDARDQLKRINLYPPDLRNPDTRAFFARFPNGVHIPLAPVEVGE